MSGPAFNTPRQALDLMVAAGAEFALHARNDGQPPSFTYRVRSGGDRERCREILAEVKCKPKQFFAAFRSLVAEIAERSAA